MHFQHFISGINSAHVFLPLPFSFNVLLIVLSFPLMGIHIISSFGLLDTAAVAARVSCSYSHRSGIAS